MKAINLRRTPCTVFVNPDGKIRILPNGKTLISPVKYSDRYIEYQQEAPLSYDSLEQLVHRLIFIETLWYAGACNSITPAQAYEIGVITEYYNNHVLT